MSSTLDTTADSTRTYRTNREDWGSIRKRSSGRYQASYTGPDGQRYNAPTTFDSLREARAWLAAQRLAIQRGEWRSPRAVVAEQFGVYSTAWLAQRVSAKGEPLRPKTLLEYRRQLATGLAEFGLDRISDITPARVRKWHAERMESGRTLAGAEARLLRAILNTAIVDGLISKNPVDSNLTRTHAGIVHRPPTLAELGVVLDSIEPQFKLAVLLAAYGGLRFGEWRALRRNDVTFIAGRATVRVERSAQYLTGTGWHVGPPKSSDGIRTVTLPKGLTEEVEAHLAAYVGAFPEALLFAPAGGQGFLHDRQFNRTWNFARDAAGIRALVREHDLRHFYGSALAAMGHGLPQIQRALGHGTAAATLMYLHAVEEHDVELADNMPMPVAGVRTLVTSMGSVRGAL
jgi:integrase